MATVSKTIASSYSGFTMGVDFNYIAAWVLPLLTGSGLWIALNGSVRRPGDPAVAVGAGWLIGVFVAAGCARWSAPADTAHAFAHAWPWVAAIGVIAWIAAIVRIRRAEIRVRFVEESAHAGRVRWTRLLWWLLLLLIVVRFLLIGDEASMRPVFPWDAWSAWSMKPKAWFLAGRMEPYVPMIEWIAQPQAALRTAGAWSYPELLAWVQLWFASAAGAWNEPLVDLAWSGALCAFALAAYGCWRAFALPPWMALGLVYALVSLPLIDAHVALAGYADIWVAITLGLALLAWTHWLLFRERGQWVLALAIAFCLPMLKLEGTVWLLAFLVVVVLDLLPKERRLRVLIAAGALLAVGAFVALLFGVGVVHFVNGGVEIASLGTFGLGWHSVGGAMVASLFTLPNWHLLWYLVPLLLILRARRFRDDRSARLLGLLVLFDFAFLFVLFFLTGAGAWAEDFTSANRLILQVVPSVFVLASVLLRGVDDALAVSSRPVRDTTPARAVPNVPA
jgi:hypothetical protein